VILLLDFKEKQVLIDWVNQLRDVLSVVFVFVLNISAFFKNVISVILMIRKLNHTSSVVLSLSETVSAGFLSIFALIIFVMEAIIVAIRRELSVVQFFVIVSYSLHILWSINNFWVMWGLIVICLSAVNSLGEVVKLPPFSTWLGLRVNVIIPLNSFSKLVMDESTILDVVYLGWSMLMVSDEYLRSTGVLYKQENRKGYG